MSDIRQFFLLIFLLNADLARDGTHSLNLTGLKIYFIFLIIKYQKTKQKKPRDAGLHFFFPHQPFFLSYLYILPHLSLILTPSSLCNHQRRGQRPPTRHLSPSHRVLGVIVHELAQGGSEVRSPGWRQWVSAKYGEGIEGLTMADLL